MIAIQSINPINHDVRVLFLVIKSVFFGELAVKQVSVSCPTMLAEYRRVEKSTIHLEKQFKHTLT